MQASLNDSVYFQRFLFLIGSVKLNLHIHQEILSMKVDSG